MQLAGLFINQNRSGQCNNSEFVRVADLIRPIGRRSAASDAAAGQCSGAGGPCGPASGRAMKNLLPSKINLSRTKKRAE